MINNEENIECIHENDILPVDKNQSNDFPCAEYITIWDNNTAYDTYSSIKGGNRKMDSSVRSSIVNGINNKVIPIDQIYPNEFNNNINIVYYTINKKLINEILIIRKTKTKILLK